MVWGGRLSESSQILEWSPVVGGGGGVLRELSRDGLPWMGGSFGGHGTPWWGGVLRAIPKRWWK